MKWIIESFGKTNWQAFTLPFEDEESCRKHFTETVTPFADRRGFPLSRFRCRELSVEEINRDGIKYMYLYNEDTGADEFFEKGLEPVGSFCFFLSQEKCLRHFFRRNIEKFNPESEEDIVWLRNLVSGTTIPISELSLEVLQDFHKRFVLWFGEEFIIPVPVDVEEFNERR